jgi:hypothetical protein
MFDYSYFNNSFDLLDNARVGHFIVHKVELNPIKNTPGP